MEWLFLQIITSYHKKISELMSFIAELKWRGLLQDMSPGLEEEMSKGRIKGYIGFDPTAASLTIGNLVSVMLLKHLQLAGHQPIVLLGGATGRIGDPSGKDKERNLLDYEVLEKNIERQSSQFARFLSFEGENKASMLNNYDFYKDMSIFEFLRDIGKHITVNYMLSKDSVKSRIESESGISFTEFSYQLIQGYDFRYLCEKENCILQMGGADQWGNITTGTELIRKSGGKGYGLTCPLLTRADGKKFGKSEEGNIWLDAEMTSPYKFYQFWLNISDEDLQKLFRIFSLKSKDEIEHIEDEYKDNPNQIKRLLAAEMTARTHGEMALQAAVKTTEIAFNPKLEKEFLLQLSTSELEMIAKELDSSSVSRSELENGINIVDLLSGKHASLSSKSEVKRAIKGAAIAVNTEKINDENQIIDSESLLEARYLFLQNGKKNKFILVAE
jgi:tyrosyl-tRNA synthetase